MAKFCSAIPTLKILLRDATPEDFVRLGEAGRAFTERTFMLDDLEPAPEPTSIDPETDAYR